MPRKKRRFSEFNDGLPIYLESLEKSRRLSNGQRLTIESDNAFLNNNFFTNPDDKEQYQKIFVSIDQSTYGIAQNIIKNIAEFSVGVWIECPNSNCNCKDMSFLNKDCLNSSGIQCIVCQEHAYFQWCYIHNKPFAISDLFASNTFCVGCWKTACKASILQCKNCNASRCPKCMLDSNLCAGCSNHKKSNKVLSCEL